MTQQAGIITDIITAVLVIDNNGRSSDERACNYSGLTEERSPILIQPPGDLLPMSVQEPLRLQSVRGSHYTGCMGMRVFLCNTVFLSGDLGLLSLG